MKPLQRLATKLPSVPLQGLWPSKGSTSFPERGQGRLPLECAGIWGSSMGKVLVLQLALVTQPVQNISLQSSAHHTV